MPVYGFFHFYYTECLSGVILRWAQIFEECFYAICLSGLLEETKLLTICVVGLPEDDPRASYFKRKTEKYKNVKLFFYENGSEYEFPTLKRLWHRCRSEDCYVYYLHSKGASYDTSRGLKKIVRVDHWRNKMILSIIVNWKRCLKALRDGYLTCGYQRDKRKKLKNTYAGNFFWASSSHISKLPEPKLLNDRWDAEHWINKMKAPYLDIHLDEEKGFGL